MPHIFDNINEHLLPHLRDTIGDAYRADFCVGYFNLRGWKVLADAVDQFAGGEDACCRVLVGMNRTPQQLMREAQRARPRGHEGEIDRPTAARYLSAALQGFREQLEAGVPTAQAEATLRQLAAQLRAGKVRIKLFLRYQLHAKLYLLHLNDRRLPLYGYLGSSNLTYSGLNSQGELNIDVPDSDAASKLQRWFDDRWGDEFAQDISEQLADMIENGWPVLAVRPYHVYLKMAFYLSEEARNGERNFQLPRQLRGVLLNYQERAVSMATACINQRRGVLLGDVVGLGKTMMATAVAKLLHLRNPSRRSSARWR